MDDILRENNIDLFMEIVNDHLMSIRMEESCYLSASKRAMRQNIIVNWDNDRFVDIYGTIVSTVARNIDPESDINLNQGDFQYSLLIKLRDNDELADTIGFMTSSEMNPHINGHIKAHIVVRSNQKIEAPPCRMFTCRRCKNNYTDYREKQTRGGDEASTLFITCRICKFTWRDYG